MERVLAIVGPTGSGKTALALQLAKKYGGEVINADTRQFYRDARIGTNLPAGREGVHRGNPVYFVDGIPHHLMACLSPTEQWSVLEWRSRAETCVREISQHGGLPILVGGTGLYVRALLQGYILPVHPVKEARRTELSSWSLDRLVAHLQRISPQWALHIDLQNPRRVIRAIERAEAGEEWTDGQKTFVYEALSLAREASLEERRPRIERAIETQFEAGWIEEVMELKKNGVLDTDPLMQAIGYREISRYLSEGGELAALKADILHKTWLYVRRQLTWFRREPGLVWVKTDQEAIDLVDDWLRSTDNRLL
jgi:tRNA dimethylallyltransferase